MSTNVQVNGVSFLSIKEAALRFKYTRDYVARLAREGKITALREGRQWLVDPTSLQKFSETAELLERARQNQLRLERKRERMVKEAIEASRLSLVTVKRRHHSRALSLAVCACFVSLCVGYALHVSPISTIPTMYQLARTPTPPPPTHVAMAPESPKHELPVTVSFMERPQFTDSFEVRSFASSTTGVMLLPTEGEFTTAERIQNAFSDEVVVMLSEDGVGTVRLKDAVLTDGEVVEIPIVTVPVRSTEVSDGEVTNVTP